MNLLNLILFNKSYKSPAKFMYNKQELWEAFLAASTDKNTNTTFPKFEKWYNAKYN